MHLANANADLIRVRGGVGSVDLDFGGTWTRDLEVSTRLAIGSLTLRVPDDVGLRLDVRRVAASFDHEGTREARRRLVLAELGHRHAQAPRACRDGVRQIEVKPSTR